MKKVIFLPKKLVLLFHEQLIQTYGGSHGIRDEKLLASALGQPEATFEGKYLHDNLIKMAAAYGYHICNNHPFIDGNKRIALVAMDVFLQRNGYEIKATEKETYSMMMKLASGKFSKDELVQWLESNVTSIRNE